MSKTRSLPRKCDCATLFRQNSVRGAGFCLLLSSTLPRATAVAISLILLSGPIAHAQVSHDLLWDLALSSRIGAENISTVHRSLSALENRYLPPRWTDENTAVRKMVGISYRMARSVLIDFPLVYMAALSQHEVFGHGAAYRHVGGHADEYVLRLPFPYGPGGGLARPSPGARLRGLEDVWMSANGVNGNLVLGQTVRDQAARRGSLRYDEALLGLAGHLDTPTYIWTPPEDGVSKIGDVASYVSGLQLYGRNRSLLTLDDLKQRALVTLADPFAWMATWTILRDYIWRGSTSSSLWMIDLGSVRYLPSVHLSLAPFGPEVLLEHLVVRNNQLWTMSMRFGNGPWGRFAGLGLEIDPLLSTDRLEVGTRSNFWYQPQVIPDEVRSTPESLPRELGGRIEATASVRPSSDWPVSGVVTLGYKTEGFVLGEHLDSGPLIELGLRLRRDSWE